MNLTSSQLLDRIGNEIKEVTAQQVAADRRAGCAMLIVDVRERSEVLEGHIPEARLIPRGFLEMSIEEEVTPDREAEIVVYCAGGHRSLLAARDLAFMGYKNVRSMVGGFKAWQEAGGAVVQGDVLSADDAQRYARHITLPEVGESGQRRLLSGRVLIVGVGGLGCPAALYLAAAGVGHIGLVDADVVDKSNLQRQVLFGESQLRRPKAEVARDRLLDLNPTIAVKAHDQLLVAQNIFDLIEEYDILVNCCDNFPTRYLLNDAAVIKNKPIVDGSIYRFEGQVTVYMPGVGPCYRCLHPEPPPPGAMPSCAEGGVLGVLPGTVGLIQATEVVKLLLQRGQPLIGRLLLYDALYMEFREIKMKRKRECPVCGDAPSIVELIDYEQFCGLPSGR